MRNAFITWESDEDIAFTPDITVPAECLPNAITFASNDSKLVVGLSSGSILIYDVQTLVSGSIQPSHVFPPSTGSAPREIAANPGDLPDLCAVLYEPTAAGQRIDLFDIQKLQVVGSCISSGTPETTPSSSKPCPSTLCASAHLMLFKFLGLRKESSWLLACKAETSSHTLQQICQSPKWSYQDLRSSQTRVSSGYRGCLIQTFIAYVHLLRPSLRSLNRHMCFCHWIRRRIHLPK